MALLQLQTHPPQQLLNSNGLRRKAQGADAAEAETVAAATADAAAKATAAELGAAASAATADRAAKKHSATNLEFSNAGLP